MNKAELIERIAAKTDSSKRSAERFLNTFLTEVEDALANGEDVRLTDFGHWEVYTKKGRNFHNVNKQQVIPIPPTRAVRFTVGKQLKDRIQALPLPEDSDLTYGDV